MKRKYVLVKTPFAYKCIMLVFRGWYQMSILQLSGSGVIQCHRGKPWLNFYLIRNVLTLYIQNTRFVIFFLSFVPDLSGLYCQFSQHQTFSITFNCRCKVVNEFWSVMVNNSGFILGGPCISPWSKIFKALRSHVQNWEPEIKVWVTSSLFERTI